MDLRIGIGHDTHRLGGERPLKLGGVTIPHESGLIGHSDADALIHAAIDAVLGALGRGDIGKWFPDTDPAHKDADSARLLADVMARALRPAGTLVNVDCIVFAERPRISPYGDAIRTRLAELLGIDEARVNLKAKTGERVGPVGRGECISAEVVVLVRLNPAA